MIIKSLDKDLDIRDRWLGIRQLKSKFAPTPYHNRDKQGKHIPWKERAQTAAEHLSQNQWGKPDNQKKTEDNKDEETTATASNTRDLETQNLTQNTQNTKPPTQHEEYKTHPPTQVEVNRVIKKHKSQKHQDQTEYRQNYSRK